MDLFSPNLISKEVTSTLPTGFILKPLNTKDWDKGFLECLSHLTVVGKLSHSEFLDQFYFMKHAKNYYVIVIEDVESGKVAAAGTIMVEHKFIHANGLAGHIEDIVVNKSYRGKNFGKWIIEGLKCIGKAVGCYKIILDCADHNVAFYEKCGFVKKEIEMVLYIKENDRSAKL